MTDDIGRRVWEHQGKAYRGFSARYGCDRLVWYEEHPTRESAFVRERRIKEWRRSWKLMLIEASNPTWADLLQLPTPAPYDLGPGIRRDERR